MSILVPPDAVPCADPRCRAGERSGRPQAMQGPKGSKGALGFLGLGFKV